MEDFRVAAAVDSDWRACTARVAAALGCRPQDREAVGFVYIADHFADGFAAVRDRLVAATGIRAWVGSVGIGVHWGEVELLDQPAIVAAVAPMPAGSYLLFESGDAVVGGGERFPFGVIHVDPARADAARQVARLAEASGAFLIGGLASSRRPISAPSAPFAGSALSGVMFRDSVSVLTGLTQGCTPLGPVHHVSEARDHVILSLDGRPAFDVFCEDIGELLARDLSRIGGYVHAALPLVGSDRADYLVRNLIAIDPGRRWLAIAEPVAAGDRILFVRRDPVSARKDLRAMLEGLAGRMQAPPRGALYFSCIARGAHMFGDAGAELALIQEALGSMPLVGFACGGEICNGRLYGYTGVLAVFT